MELPTPLANMVKHIETHLQPGERNRACFLMFQGFLLLHDLLLCEYLIVFSSLA